MPVLLRVHEQRLERDLQRDVHGEHGQQLDRRALRQREDDARQRDDGPDECKGNKLQACAQKHYPANAAWVSLFRCMGAAFPDPVGSAQACAEAAGMDFGVIETCFGNGEGDALIYANAQATGALNPKKQGVPWVVVNDVPVDDRDHLLAAICDAYVGTKPDCCAAASRKRTRRADPVTRAA